MNNIVFWTLMCCILCGLMYGISNYSIFLILFAVGAIPLFSFGVYGLILSWIVNPIKKLIKKKK